jgi:hypothetical protein
MDSIISTNSQDSLIKEMGPFRLNNADFSLKGIMVYPAQIISGAVTTGILKIYKPEKATNNEKTTQEAFDDFPSIFTDSKY